MSRYVHRRIAPRMHSSVVAKMEIHPRGCARRYQVYMYTVKLGRKRPLGHHFSPQKRHGPEKGEGQEHDESFFHSIIVITCGNLDIQKVDWSSSPPEL